MKAAIVSSVSESCGNAAFTQILLETLKAKDLEVTGVRLNLDLTQATDPLLSKMADAHVVEIAKQLSQYGAVNLQYEPGLYGPNLSKIRSRLKVLLNVESRYVVTIHSTRLFSTDKSGLVKPFTQQLLRLHLFSAFRSLSTTLNARRIARGNRACIRLFVKRGAHLVVHTHKSAALIKELFKYENVSVHPLKFIDPHANTKKVTDWKRVLGLQDEQTTIGVFGYISAYKGHETSILALSNLPHNHVLLIAGRQHPQTVKDNVPIDPYLSFLMAKIEEISAIDLKRKRKPLKDRIYFLNELNDREFFDLAASVDFAWLPYQEVGQDGSGMASILFDLSKRVIASNSKAFDELIALEPGYQCERFDIGNYLELANKTLNYREYRNLESLKFTLATQRDLYRSLLEKD
jgi:glycosyltransferase involved in cell wall biosynthesis